MLCPISKELESKVISKIKKDLITEIARLEQLILVYSDRDWERCTEIQQEIRGLEMKLLEVM
jgi:hypothetical protein